MSEIDSALAKIAQSDRALRTEVERMRKLYVEEGKKNRILTTQIEELRSSNKSLEYLIKKHDKIITVEKVGGLPLTPKPEETYGIGDQFAGDKSHNATHILAQTGPGEVNLIGLETGNRFSQVLKPKDICRIPKSAFDAHFHGSIGMIWRKVS